VRRLIAPLGWVLLVAAVADWAMLRSGWLGHAPVLLALLVAAALLAFALRAVQLLVALARSRDRRWSRALEIALLAGISLGLGAGMANWMLGLQGYVVLIEGETVPLHGGDQLQAFEAGPLARIEEMVVVLSLDELELVAMEPGGFHPRSRLRVGRDHGEPESLEVTPRDRASLGPLRFHQGAFGFAPRIVLLREGEEVFERVVPFLTRRHGESGLSFSGRFTVEKESLLVEGLVDLASLDEGMRGHATLELALSRGDDLLGEGRLLPGHFADIGDDLRVGFVGLGKWSEVLVSRRNYGRLVLVGAAAALAAAILWIPARWSGR
jgi:hypothetical protein